MKNKKHIDELFKERFKNHETAPPPHVWDNIQAKLQEKKKDRKVIPLWWKLGGVAALLALLLTVGQAIFNTDKSQDKLVIEDTTTRSIEHTETEKDGKTEESIVNDSQVASETEEKPTGESGQDTFNNNQTLKVNEASNQKFNTEQNNKAAVAVAHNKQSTQTTPSEKDDQKTNSETIAIASETDNNTLKNTSKDEGSTAIASEQTNSKSTDQVKGENDDLINKDSAISNKVGKNNTEIATAKTKEETDRHKDHKETGKKSIFEEIEAAKKTAEAVATTNKPENRWDVAPNVAPVYYSSISGGSSIDPTFADNSQSSDINISYGVQVAYNITDRLSVRSGINNVNLGYATGGVDIGTGPVSYGLRTVDYNESGTVIVAVDKGAFNNPMDGFGSVTPKSTGGNAQIIQDISYYEVPLELKYAVLDTRFGINMIGGLSTLFLGNNEISVEDGGFRSVLGEANNLNQVSFTTNVGVGFDYKISKRLKFNVEPMFKYQLNPYTDSSVGFKPYYIGLYSGLSFKF
ncbi:outer membrane beta-barrel protein [Marixanthomonas spongiae]|uniref:Outer membrane protein beta-barrel domain-containing protein n=1 Tax=Marixanthomonas spongiae TaxID=2174845 RepID=A0A2U0I1X4_9FLAO|nr:outer membrane beta-barrel protein [Marixanthomonas spongiae]PVW15074.1 hypothetical protein DDV96_06600 [Marixanthomonas spongiae]